MPPPIVGARYGERVAAPHRPCRRHPGVEGQRTGLRMTGCAGR
jgi:hypothetical protein